MCRVILVSRDSERKRILIHCIEFILLTYWGYYLKYGESQGISDLRKEILYQRTMEKRFKFSVWTLSQSSGKLIKLSFRGGVSEEDRGRGGCGCLCKGVLKRINILLVNRGKKIGIIRA